MCKCSYRCHNSNNEGSYIYNNEKMRVVCYIDHYDRDTVQCMAIDRDDLDTKTYALGYFIDTSEITKININDNDEFVNVNQDNIIYIIFI